ncbi:MAG: hypothetical protein ACLQB4_05940 [Beijerinckiaceae bacterium]
MTEEINSPMPLSPSEKEQARLRREAELLQERRDELAAQILAKEGAAFKIKAESEYGETDPQRLELIAAVAANIKATRDTEPLRIQPADHRGLVGDAIDKVDADELARQQQPTPEATESQLRETEEARKQQLLNTAEELRLPPARTAIEQSDRAELASVHLAKEFAAKGDASAQQWLNDHGQSLGTQDSGAAAWVAQAESLDRQRHQHGRYDFSDPPGPSGPSGSRPNDPPQPSTPPRSPLPNSPSQGKLSADEVFERFTDPAKMARYNKDTQQREEDAKSFLQSVGNPARTAASGGSSADPSRQDDLMAAFSPSAIKKKTEETRAERANDSAQAQSQGRGGGRGR